MAEWRSQHNAPFPANDPRFAISKRYEPIRLCVFCTQFFDQDFSDYMSIAQYCVEIKVQAPFNSWSLVV